MNFSLLFRRFILGVTLALIVAGTAVTAVGAQEPADPTIAAPGRTSIITDKNTYAVGESTTITYTLPGPGWYRITDNQGGTVSTLRSGYNAQGRGRFTGTVTPPTGKECLKLQYWSSYNQTSTAETCFEVTQKTNPGPQVVTPGVYNLQSRFTGLMLDSNLEKKVYAHVANGGAFQKWVLEAGPEGFFFLRDLATGYYLDDTSPIGHVATEDKNLGIYQQWKAVPGREGSFILVNRETGRGLVGSPQGVFTNDDYATAESLPYEWKLTAVQP